ncbi:MAG: N-acetyl-gamma-glutamyl-phosphate reductase [Planctomycetes bacterium]|nr:N-acetyl-gamma-glutamyl-phosphate reductase [Planctomycetota bacterium]
MPPARQKRIAVVGGAGYGGGELLRFLLFHPGVTVGDVTSRTDTGPVEGAHPNLRGLTDLRFVPFDAARVAGHDLAFFALPNHQAAEIVPRVLAERADLPIIDLSGDFRLDDAAEFQAFYGRPHPDIALARTFVYGLTEFNRAEIARARLVANPGCFATAVQLAVTPLVKAGLPVSRVFASCVTGSSGSGAEPTPKTHHPTREGSLSAYKVLEHQHTPEILRQWREAGEAQARLYLAPQSGPFVRGIFACCHVLLARAATEAAVEAAFRAAYQGERFVRLVPGTPDVRVVARSNFADLSWKAAGDVVVALCALDNLVKGMAGQAVQNMNLMLGLEESASLLFPGTNP